MLPRAIFLLVGTGALYTPPTAYAKRLWNSDTMCPSSLPTAMVIELARCAP